MARVIGAMARVIGGGGGAMARVIGGQWLGL